jgi:hypothetical protein
VAAYTEPPGLCCVVLKYGILSLTQLSIGGGSYGSQSMQPSTSDTKLFSRPCLVQPGLQRWRGSILAPCLDISCCHSIGPWHLQSVHVSVCLLAGRHQLMACRWHIGLGMRCSAVACVAEGTARHVSDAAALYHGSVAVGVS